MTGPALGLPLEQQPAAVVERLNLWAEARGEGVVGMAGVWHVVNRRSAQRDTTRAEEVLRAKQFSWTMDPHYVNRALLAYKLDPVNWAIADAVCTLGEAGLLTDPTGGADHYLNRSALKEQPSWSLPENGWVKTWTHGRHEFGRCA